MKSLVFPGQGSQYVGMGKDLLDSFPEIKVTFEEVNDALDQNLSTLMFDGPEDKLILTEKYFTQWNVSNPKIGVAALNPHASDGGLIGNEEFDEILPAIDEAKKIGINAIGPVPALAVHQSVACRQYRK